MKWSWKHLRFRFYGPGAVVHSIPHPRAGHLTLKCGRYSVVPIFFCRDRRWSF